VIRLLFEVSLSISPVCCLTYVLLSSRLILVVCEQGMHEQFVVGSSANSTSDGGQMHGEMQLVSMTTDWDVTGSGAG